MPSKNELPGNILQIRCSWIEVQRCWRNIRDQYVHTKKNCVVHSGQEPPNHRSCWELYPFLTFLEDFVAHRPTSSNLDNPSTSAAHQTTTDSPPMSQHSSPNTCDGSSHHDDLDVVDIGIPLAESVSSVSSLSACFTPMPVTPPDKIPEVTGSIERESSTGEAGTPSLAETSKVSKGKKRKVARHESFNDLPPMLTSILSATIQTAPDEVSIFTDLMDAKLRRISVYKRELLMSKITNQITEVLMEELPNNSLLLDHDYRH